MPISYRFFMPEDVAVAFPDSRGAIQQEYREGTLMRTLGQACVPEAF